MTAPVISVLPDAPQRGVDSQEVFTSKANPFVDSLGTLVSETNAMGTWMNTTASEVESDRIASAASATAAASSSSSASSSATTATTKASEASSSATSASSSAVVASTAATTATTKASEASSSASSASASATTATTKASEASASAASASGSANTSSTQASIAIQKATEAGNSANSAAASAANAALSLGDYRGDYYAPTSYIAGQSVSYNGSIYIAKQGTTGNLPTNTTYWFKGTGAAAVYDVTASPTDTTAGRLLKVGDFGLGSNLAALPLATVDDTSIPTGNYWSTPDTLGVKPLGASYGYVTIFNEADNDVARQVYRETSNNDVYERFRTTTSGGWQPWVRLLKVGDGGVIESIPFNGNIDTIIVNGTYRLLSVTGIPQGVTVVGDILVHQSWDANAATQQYYQYNEKKMHTRQKVNGAWLSWERVLQTNDVTTSTTDTTAGRLLKVGDGGLLSAAISLQTTDDALLVRPTATYMGFGCINAPEPSAWFFYEVKKHNDAYAEITASSFTGTPKKYFTSIGGGVTPVWKQIYHTGNILGTVSQTGGVPTGSIIQRGSNANGEFVKFADGTMICTRSALPQVNDLSHNIALAGGFRSSGAGAGTWTYPVAFVSAPAITYSLSGDALPLNGTGSILVTNATLLSWRSTNGLASVTASNLIAIGRWY